MILSFLPLLLFKISFADYLYKKGEYLFAAEEYLRSYVLNDEKNTLCFNYYKSLYSGAYYNKLIKSYQKDICHLGAYKTKALLLYGDSLFQKGLYNKAKYAFKKTIKSYKNISYNRLLFINLYQKNFKEAKRYAQIESLKREIELLEKYKKKDPYIGLTLSLFPGGGQFYNEEIGDGITNIFVITTLSILTYIAIKNNYPTLGFTLGGITIIFYIGNLYGGYVGSIRYNKRFFETNIKRLENIYLEPISPDKL